MTRIFVVLIGMYIIGGLVFIWKNLYLIMTELHFIMIEVELNEKEDKKDKGIALIIAIIEIIRCLLMYPYHIYKKKQYKNRWLKEHGDKK